MKNSLFVIILIFSAVLHSCKSKENAETKKGNSKKQSITLTIDFYPSWGGSAEAILERKNGKDNLYSTYNEKVKGVDTVLTMITFVPAITADSIYKLAELVNWNDDANHGTADPRVGLKFNMSIKKGRNLRAVGWESLVNANELPEDIIPVIRMVNRISPDDFKIY
ncbi:hypothetical protein BH09BAC5_BH09BAC5_08760 [soil metagenome]